MCILNGRNSVRNEFTSISVKGCSVVDYFITPYDSLNYLTVFTVTRTTDSNIPDHSLLSWNIVFNEFVDVTIDENVKSGSFDKVDVRNVTDTFLLDPNVLFQVNNVINKLEQGQCFPTKYLTS